MRAVIVGCVIFLAGCKDKNTTDLPTTATDKKEFFGLVKPLALPWRTDGKPATKDSNLAIAIPLFTSLLPDSVSKKYVTDTVGMRITASGQISTDGYVYMLLNFWQKSQYKKGVFVFKDKVYQAQQLLTSGKKDGYQPAMLINHEPTFIVTLEKKLPAGNFFTKTGYAYSNDAKKFIVIMNETNEPMQTTMAANPMDTMPAHNKYSGDYMQNAKNFISIRDGKTKEDYIFFIYFNKENGACTGELMGSLAVAGPGQFIYSKPGDPCVIDVTCTTTTVVVKEQGTCGNYRGITCSFDDTYTKKKLTAKEKKVAAK